MPFSIHLKLLLYSSEYRIFGESQFYFEDLLFKHTALYLCKIAIQSSRNFHFDFSSHHLQVELGMPYEMWDTPSVEVVTLKQNCETLLERYENDLEQWYHIQDRPLLEVVLYLRSSPCYTILRFFHIDCCV